MKKYRRFSIEEVINRIEKVHNGNVSLDISTYTTTKKKARFIDKDYGEYWTFPANVLKGHKSRKRSNFDRRLPLEQLKETIFKVHGDSIVIVEDTYVNMHTFADFIDKIYGKWKATPSNIVGGMRHKKRSDASRRISMDEIVKKIKEVHGDDITLDIPSYRGNLNKKTRFFDKIFGEFFAVPADILAGHSNRRRGVGVAEKTKIAKYGVPYPQSLPTIKAKIIATNMEKYGFPCVLQNEDIKEKCRQTNLELYGVENVSQNKEIALKISKSQNNSVILHHWKTGKEIVCRAGYELKVVTKWNGEKEDFDWQLLFDIPEDVFKTTKGKKSTYPIDAYLPRLDLYVEIKGHFYDEESKLKWEWFHETHPNSELWDEKKLNSLGIKTGYQKKGKI